MKNKNDVTGKIIEGFSDRSSSSSSSSPSAKNDANISIIVPLALFVTTSAVYYHRLLLRDYQRFLRTQQRQERQKYYQVQQKRKSHDRLDNGYDDSGNSSINSKDDDENDFETLYRLQRSRDRLSFDASHFNDNIVQELEKESDEEDSQPQQRKDTMSRANNFIVNRSNQGIQSNISSFDMEDPNAQPYSMDFLHHKSINMSHFEEISSLDSPKAFQERSNDGEVAKTSPSGEGKKEDIDNDAVKFDKEWIVTDDTDVKQKETSCEREKKNLTWKTSMTTKVVGQQEEHQKEPYEEEKKNDERGKSAKEDESKETMSSNNTAVKARNTVDQNDNRRSWVPSLISRLSSNFPSFLTDDDDESNTIAREMNVTYAGNDREALLTPPYPPTVRSSSSSQTSTPSHVRKRMESARTDYNARIMPAKVIMVRHGQSEGNLSENLYATKPDNAMQLTKLGWEQARMAGKALRERLLRDNESIHFIVSPYARTMETFHGIVSAWCDPSEFDHIEDRDLRLKAWYEKLSQLGLSWHEDPRIREQDFGNYQDPATIKKCKRERNKFGVFYYRFPHGESASDVFDRVSTFLDSLWRSFDLQRSRNYVLITHGISIRVLLARYFRYSIDQFNMLANPKNCEMVILGHDGMGKLRLDGRCTLELKSKSNGDPDNGNEMEVIGYNFHEKLSILPSKHIVKRVVRMTDDVMASTLTSSSI